MERRCTLFRLAGLLLALAGAGPACAGAEGDWRALPTGHLFAPYAADPHRVTFAVAQQRIAESDIPGAGTNRLSLRTGARLPLARFEPADAAGTRWQVGLPVGFDGVFDHSNNEDNIGWDGNYGLLVTASPDPALAFKGGLLHTSSHVGDEYIERTGRKRIDYTREEWLLAVSWRPLRRWRTYLEGAWAYGLNNTELQEEGRAQAGVEFERPHLFGAGVDGYAAVDLAAWAERDWRVDTTVQAGAAMRADGRRWRIGLEYHDGRPPLGEFFQATERYTALVLSLDV